MKLIEKKSAKVNDNNFTAIIPFNGISASNKVFIKNIINLQIKFYRKYEIILMLLNYN